MKAFVQKYFSRHFSIENLFPPPQQTDNSLDFNQFKLSASRKVWLAIVSYSHWVCGLGLLIGILVVDALQVPISLWQIPFTANFFHPVQLVKTLSVSGLIGYGTNYIAIQMLFRPVEKRPIWGQGLVPAQRDRILFTLAGGLHKHVLNQELLLTNLKKADFTSKIAELMVRSSMSLLQDEELRTEIRSGLIEILKHYFAQPHIQEQIAEMIDQKLNQNLKDGWKKWLISSYKSYKSEDYKQFMEKMIAEVPEAAGVVLEKFEAEKLQELTILLSQQTEYLTQFLNEILIQVLNRLDIPDLLRKQMAHFDDRKLERMVWDASNEQLLYIQYLGTVLGILGGLILWQPLLMLGVYGVLLGGLWLLDKILYERNREKIKRNP